MLPVFIAELCRKNKLLVFRYFATSIGRAACSVLTVVMIQQFLVITHKNGGALVRLLTPIFGPAAVPGEMAALLIGVHIFNSLLGYDNRVTAQRLSEILEFGIMDRIIRNVLGLSVQFFKRQSVTELIQTVCGDVSGLQKMTYAYALIVRAALMALSLAAIVFWLSPLLAFISLVLLPLVGLPVVAYSAKHMRLASRRLRARGPFLYNAILQIVSGIRIIKAYGGEETEARLSRENGRTHYALLMEVVRRHSLMNVLLESVGGFSLVAVITLGGYQVARGRMSWDALVAFVFSTRSLFGPLYEIQGSVTDISAHHASVERVKELLAARSEVRDSPHAEPLLTAPRTIAFEHVNFGYSGPQVLHDISFQVHAGETIGIVGPSGGGKSTLLSLIARFDDPTSGRVTFDGMDLRDFRLADVYGLIAIVTQDPFLFATTVRENIRCARAGASNAEVEAAAQGAWIHEEILALPNGYETVVGMGGRELSRGQSQRINVARALLKNSPLLMLDEATASLDSVAEAEVQRAIDRLMKGRTCFIVAHRLSTLKNADRLMVLDRGQCIGFGTHDQLVRDCALYRQFWELQKLGETDLNAISSMLVPTREHAAAAVATGQDAAPVEVYEEPGAVST